MLSLSPCEFSVSVKNCYNFLLILKTTLNLYSFPNECGLFDGRLLIRILANPQQLTLVFLKLPRQDSNLRLIG